MTKFIRINFMFKKIKKYFFDIKNATLLKYDFLKAQIKFYWLLISNPNTREYGAFPIMAAWAIVVGVVKIGAMLFVANEVATFIEGDPKFFAAILGAAAQFLTMVSQAWVELASGALSFVLKDWVTADIVGTTTSVAGWVLIRDLANMSIVLGFVVVGVAFTLRLENYGSKKVLINLILVALLVNFSGLICGLIIDASNIVIKFLLESANAGNMIMEFKDLSSTMLTSIKPQATGDVYEKLAISALILFTNLLIMVSFFTYAILFILRYVMLNILFMFSPLAFVCFVFPFSKKYAQMWWDNFLKWCFIGVIGLFFIWFAARLLNFWTTTPEPWGIYHLIIIFVILMAGYKFTKSTSAMGASIAIGLVAGAAGTAKGKITGGARRLGGEALKKMRGEKDKNQEPLLAGARDWMSENLGSGGPGYAAQRRKERASAYEKQLDAMASSPANTRDRQRYEELVRTGRGAQGAAAVAKANERGELATILGNNGTVTGGALLNRINDRATYSGAFGYERKDFENKHHELTGLDEAKVTRELGVLGIADNPINRARAQSSVNRKQLEKNWGNMSTAERANINLSGLDNTNVNPTTGRTDLHEFILNRNGDDMKAFLSSDATHPNRTILRSLGGTGGVIDSELTAAAGNTNKQRRLNEVLDVANRM